MISVIEKRLTWIRMTWIDHKKAYDMVPHSCLNKCVMFGLEDNKQYVTAWKNER